MDQSPRNHNSSSEVDYALDEWFKEKWVDISKKDKSGKHPPCGRKDADKGKYPKCRPSKRVSKKTPKTTSEMTKKEKQKAVKKKRKVEKSKKTESAGGKARKPKRAPRIKRKKSSLMEHIKTSGRPISDELPKIFSREFRSWLVHEYYKIDTSYNIGSRFRLSNWNFKNEPEKEKLRIYRKWKAEKAKEEDSRTSFYEKTMKHKEEVAKSEPTPEPAPEPLQLDLFSSNKRDVQLIKLSLWLLKEGLDKEAELVSNLSKVAVLKKKVRKTRGKGKEPRKEWGLFSKKNGRPLKWFGPKKPSKKQVAKEEARIHAFS